MNDVEVNLEEEINPRFLLATGIVLIVLPFVFLVSVWTSMLAFGILWHAFGILKPIGYVTTICVVWSVGVLYSAFTGKAYQSLKTLHSLVLRA